MNPITLFVFLLLACLCTPAAESPKPNIIIIYADDLGWGDLGCYGHPSIRTPNLDRMAAEGMRFTDFYSAAEVCTPSRAALLTGRYPIRSGMCHNDRRVLHNQAKGGLPREEITLAELLKEQGYATAIVGKWHLGHLPRHLPLHHGFDSYFGMPYSNDMLPATNAPAGREKFYVENNDYWRTPLIRGTNIVEEHPDQRQLTRRYTEEALKIIREKKGGPFFLYLAHNFPHVPLFASEKFRGKSAAGLYGDVIEELDWSVGELLNTLRAEDLDKNTLVVFSSDNGPWLIFNHHGGSAGPLREGKGSTWEGGMRVPGIAWWPGRIPAGVVQHEPATTMDLFTTCAKLAGAKTPSDRPVDGVDIAALLFGSGPVQRDAFFFYRGSDLYAARLGLWKAHFTTRPGYGAEKAKPHDPPLLFHLGEDPGEKFDRATNQPAILGQIKEAVQRHQASVVAAPSQLEPVPQRAAARRPNVLFLFADDMRADTIAAHGNPHIQTPNLDRLAANGLSFRRNYVFGGNSGAVCVPSRAMLMSGKTWFHIDAPTLKGEKLLPELLGENGYATFGTGKWHNGQPSWLRAFQRGKTIMFGGMSDHTKVPVRDLGPDGKLTEERIGEKFSSGLFADSAIEFLRARDKSKPFFAYVAFTAPHDPRQPPLEFRERYYRNPPPLPPNFLPQLPFNNGMMDGGRDENLGAWPRTEKMIRDQLAEYYGLVTHMDEQIGRILAALNESGEAENTVIVFAADNGLALGSHGLLGKQSVFEHSTRTPLIIAGPSIPRGRSDEAFTYLHDLFPTFCDLLALPQPAALEGHSLRPLWTGEKDRVRDSVFLPFMNVQRAVRDERWKLIAYPRIGHLQLFDLASDPHETTNLIARAEHADTVARLQNLMAEWQTKVGDTVSIPRENKWPDRIDLTGKPRVPDQWQPDWIVKKYF